jgi:hypothetical protein
MLVRAGEPAAHNRCPAFVTLARLFAISDDIGGGDGDFIHVSDLSR